MPGCDLHYYYPSRSKGRAVGDESIIGEGGGGGCLSIFMPRSLVGEYCFDSRTLCM